MAAHHISIRRRLLMMSVLSSAMALLVACGAFLAYEYYDYRERMMDDLRTDARVLAVNVTSPLLFDDPESAQTLLAALEAKPRIQWAKLTRRGRLFSSYGTVGQPTDVLELKVPV